MWNPEKKKINIWKSLLRVIKTVVHRRSVRKQVISVPVSVSTKSFRLILDSITAPEILFSCSWSQTRNNFFSNVSVPITYFLCSIVIVTVTLSLRVVVMIQIYVPWLQFWLGINVSFSSGSVQVSKTCYGLDLNYILVHQVLHQVYFQSRSTYFHHINNS